MIVVFLIKKVFVLVQNQIILLIILFDHVSFVVIVDFDSLVFDVSNYLFSSAKIVTQAQELNKVLKLTLDWKHLLGQIVHNFDQNVIFLPEKHQQEFESAYLCVFADSVDLLGLDFLHHFIIDFFKLLEHLVEGGSLLGIISKHKVGEILPVRMQLRTILYSLFADLVDLPLLLQIIVGLFNLFYTFTPSNSSFWVSI